MVVGQWLKYPTDGCRGTPDGTLNRNAPTPRLPDGKPGSPGSGTPPIPNRCVPGAGQFVECGAEIGGSPLGGNLGRNLPGGAAV